MLFKYVNQIKVKELKYKMVIWVKEYTRWCGLKNSSLQFNRFVHTFRYFKHKDNQYSVAWIQLYTSVKTTCLITHIINLATKYVCVNKMYLLQF